MNKVFADTYWVMWGPHSSERPRLIDRAWLTSTLPPFYRGTGISIRIGKNSLRFGVCYPRMPVTVDDWSYVDDMEANLAAVGGYPLQNQEVRKWASSREATDHQPELVTETSSDDDSGS